MQLSFVEGRNRMKLCNKISKGVAKGAEVICMLTIAALVLVIVVELLRRNFLGQSFGGNVQLCGILFLWMAFIGLIPLYRDSGLMRLDFLVARTKGPVYEVLYFANKLFSLLLGVVICFAVFTVLPLLESVVPLPEFRELVDQSALAQVFENGNLIISIMNRRL